ncbi:hypothetical protein B9Z19DRAFT_1166150, partial [Tuber borchii]
LFLLFSRKIFETLALSQQKKSGKDKNTFVLPTYNERKNFPIIVWLLVKTFTKHKLGWELIIVELYPSGSYP